MSMVNYAMINKGVVIEVLHNQETEPVFPPVGDGSVVIAIPCDDSVERGMVYDEESNTFTLYDPVYKQTQLDIIQALVEKSNDELRQEGAETVTLELIERGIL